MLLEALALLGWLQRGGAELYCLYLTSGHVLLWKVTPDLADVAAKVMLSRRRPRTQVSGLVCFSGYIMLSEVSSVSQLSGKADPAV